MPRAAGKKGYRLPLLCYARGRHIEGTEIVAAGCAFFVPLPAWGRGGTSSQPEQHHAGEHHRTGKDAQAQ